MLVTSNTDVESASATYNEALRGMTNAERVWLSVVGLSPADVRRLAADNDSLAAQLGQRCTTRGRRSRGSDYKAGCNQAT